MKMLVLLAALAALPALAAPTLVIQHTGRLLNQNDTAQTGDVTLEFELHTLFATGPGDESVWAAKWEGVSLGVGGVYTISLGDTAGGHPALTPAHFAGDRWLAVKVNGTALTPWLRIGMVPTGAYALDAGKVGGLTVADLDARYAPASGAAGYVQLDPTTAQSGGVKVTGEVAGGSLRGDGANVTNLDATHVAAGTLADGRLSQNVVLLGSSPSFTGADGVTAKSFHGDFLGNGAGLTALDAGAISAGTLGDARLSSNVALLGATQAFTGVTTFADAKGKFSGDGSGLTNLNLGAANTYTDTKVTAALAAGTAVAGRIVTAASDPVPCNASNAGYLYFNSAEKAFKGCDGLSGTFSNLGSSFQSAGNPSLGPVAMFTYTGGEQPFVVPSGVTSVQVKLWGAGGGGGLMAGGAGGYTTATLAVTPGETLSVFVGGGGRVAGPGGFGGGGAGGNNNQSCVASGGGGRSAIRRSGTELLTAGGGGGGASHGSGATGGSGGGVTGGMGANGNAGSVPATGGTQTAGGAGGSNSGVNGNPGTAFTGGDGLLQGGCNGGGGGGGWYGGGGGVGNATNYATGGGGGSGYIGGSGVTAASTTGSATPNSQGQATVLPPLAGDADYLAGAGTGGALFADGGGGLVVFHWAGSVPQAPAITTNSAHGVQPFAFTGTAQDFVVPTGVTTLQVKAWGAAGGGMPGATQTGGPGGYTTAVVAVTPGETLTVLVGGGGKVAGPGGYNGGGAGGNSNVNCTASGGGGRSALRRGATELLTAGGGGGASSHGSGASGGAGGGLVGGIGSNANPGSVTAQGGTQTHGGAGGINYSGGVPQFAPAGSQYTGANGGLIGSCNGGGGGGGWYGGGGGTGNATNYATGGGGGSGYVRGPGVFGNTFMATSPNPLGGSTTFPPQQNDTDYTSSAGQGTTGEGKAGLIVIRW